MSIRQTLLSLAWLLAGAASAQTVGLPQVLRAAQDNLEVSLARRSLASAQADVQAADHAPAPVLSAKASAIDLQNGIGGGNLVRDKRIDKSIGIDWTLERGGKRELRTLAAQLAAAAVRADVEDAVVQQQLAAAAAFYDLLAAQERTAHFEAIGKSAAELAQAAARRLRAGDISQQDAARAVIEAERAAAELEAAQAERERAELALAQLTGLGTPLAAAPGWPAAPLPGAAPDTWPERAELLAAQRRVQAAQAALDMATALRRNDLTVGASIDHFPGTSTRQLELRVSMPLAGVLGGYGYDGEIARARALLEQAQDQLEKTRRAVAADVLRLQQEFRSATVRMKSYDEAIVPRARQVAGMAELAYAKGASPLTELIDARRTLRTVLLEDVAARADHARAVAAWQLRALPPQR